MDVSAPVRAVDRVQRSSPWTSVPIAVLKRFGEHSSGRLAATIAYYGFFSLFPLLMVLTSVAAIVLANDPALRERTLESALTQFPVVGTQIRDDIGSVEGSALAIGIGIALALWAGLGGVRALQVAMDTVWDVPRRDRPGALGAIVRSLLMLAVGGSAIVAAAVLSGASGGSSGAFGAALGWIAAAFVNVLVFGFAYRLLTAADVTWRDVAPGAVVAGMIWTGLVAVGGSLVSSRVRSASDVYGTFAIVIGLLAWIYLGAQLTLLGAELNAVLAKRLWPRSLVPDRATEIDRRALERTARQEERRKEQIVDVRWDGDEAQATDAPRERRSIAALVNNVVGGFKGLVRHEVELAKIEAGEAVAAKAKGAGMLAGAGLAGLYALGFLAAAGAVALAIVLPMWASLLIVCAVFLSAGALLFVLGRRALRAPAGVEKTQETLKGDVQWAKQQIER